MTINITNIIDIINIKLFSIDTLCNIHVVNPGEGKHTIETEFLSFHSC